MAVPLGTTFRTVVTLSHPALGGIGTNTWHGKIDTSGEDAGTSDATGLLSALEEYYQALEPIFPDTLDIRSDGMWHGVGHQDGKEVDTGAGWTVNGTSPGGVLAPALCIVAGWRTGSGGRHGRGRTFLGPLAMSVAATDGTPTLAAINVVKDAASEVAGWSIDAGDSRFGVWSAPTDEHEETFYPLVSCAVRNQFASLRSRRD